MQEHTHFELGKTKVFIKNPTDVFKLDEEREKKLHDVVAKIQAAFRGYCGRQYAMKYRAV